MKNFIQKKLEQLRRDEGGAVFLLLLAAFLILFMVALTLYDTGVAANDKMSVQISADAASYSHSVVKARSMNVIVYANIIKRMYYSYFSTYMNAWTALLAHEAQMASSCNWVPATWPKCAEAVDTAVFNIVPEVAEFGFTNGPTLGIWGKKSFAEEIEALDGYSRYMHKITPWWAYVESAMRGAQNGGLVSSTWPPPPTLFTSIVAAVNSIASAIDKIFGTQIIKSLPPLTENVDTLPIARRDIAGDPWDRKFKPFDYKIGVDLGEWQAALGYCISYTLSFEHILHGLQTYSKSDEGLISLHKWRNKFLFANIVPAIGCLMSHLLYADDGYLDWRIMDDFSKQEGTKNAWAGASSSIAISYRPRRGRMEDDESRQKFGFLKKDYKKSAAYQNEGYFALSRSEIVYKQPFNFLENLNFSGPLGFASSRLGAQKAPDMWSPRWKAKGRPFVVTGETMGSSIQGADTGLSAIINDTVPMLVLSSLLAGALDPDFGAGSALKDLRYLIRIGPTFTADKLEGVPK